MCYIGENEKFAFYEGFCEQLPESDVTTSDLCEFGRAVGTLYDRICISADRPESNTKMYALCSGLSESGCDVILCSDAPLPVLRYSVEILSCGMGLFLCGDKLLKMYFFSENGFPPEKDSLSRIINENFTQQSRKYGNINQINSLGTVYLYNVRRHCDNTAKIPASISCGSKAVRSLWLEFFSGEDDETVIQISRCGQRVNIYSTEYGFISHDRLILACALMTADSDAAIYLPSDYHYIAESTVEKSGLHTVRFNPDSSCTIPSDKTRYITDPLFMCTRLLSDKRKFYDILGSIPSLCSAQRTLVMHGSCVGTKPVTIYDTAGKITVKPAGRGIVSLSVQAQDMESAAELCVLWEKKLKKADSCGGEFLH